MLASLDTIFATASACSKRAFQICREFESNAPKLQSRKNDNSWVTAADKKIEDELRKIILKNHPDHFILGEEEGGTLSEDENQYTWIIDPIDGTFSFIHNIPFYACLIAVLKGKEPVIGFASLPAMNVTFSAQKGKGAFLNEKPYKRPELVGQPQIEIVATGDPYRFYGENKQNLLNILYGPDIKSRTYTDGLGYYMLLMGSVRAFVDPKVEIWDVAPYHVILPEAGFAIHGWNGETLTDKAKNSIAYALDEKGFPVNCDDIKQLTKKFA